MCRFIKFIPSKEAMHLLKKHPKAFVLLTFIAERARRQNGEPDGLTVGQCHIGDYASYGLTEKEYRTAKKILVERGQIKIIETNRTRPKKINSKSTLNLENHENRADKRATRVTTHGTLTELCSTTVYDINSDDGNQQKGDQKGDRGATEGRPKGDEQEGIRKKKKEKEILPHTPSASPLPSKIKFRELVELTQEQHDSLLAKNGQEIFKLMLDKLDSFKGSTGKTYASDFHTMKEGGWVVNQVKKDLEQQKQLHEKNLKHATGNQPLGNPQSPPAKFKPGRVLRGGNEGSVDKGGEHE